MVTEVEAQVDAKLVAGLLRGLAIDVETNPTLANRVIEALVTAGLLDDDAGELSGDPDAQVTVSTGLFSTSGLIGLQVARIDTLTLYRTGGMEQLRTRLGTLDLASLKRLIQVQQLDPDKKTAKLRSAAKLVDFIVEHATTVVEQERELARTNSWML